MTDQEAEKIDQLYQMKNSGIEPVCINIKYLIKKKTNKL